MDKNETRNERFKRVAIKRTNKLLDQIRILSNCANKSAYNYTEEEINKIFSTINSSLREAHNKFHFSKKKEFKL